MNVTPFGFRRAFAFAALICSTVLPAFAAEEKRHFDVPAGDAAQTLKQFASQAKREIVFAPDAVHGVQTKAVNGELAPRDALDRMLVDTGLAVSQDKKTGAFAVKRDPGPNGSGAAQTKADDRPEREPTREASNKSPLANEAASGDEVVQLETFSVSATIGNYAEFSSRSSTKTDVPLRDVPFQSQVINHAMISDMRAQRLSDLFQYVTGMSHDYPRNVNGFSIRGVTASTGSLQNLQVNGLPGVTSRYGSPPTANVDQVEVLKGPAGVLYGYMEPGGLVNIITKVPMLKRHAELFTTIGTYASADVSSLGDDLSTTTTLDLTGPVYQHGDSKLLYRLIAAYEDLQFFANKTWANNVYLFPSLTYQWDRDTSLGLQLEYLDERRATNDGLAVLLGNVANIPNINMVYQNPTDLDKDKGRAATLEFKNVFANGWQLRAVGRHVWHTDEVNEMLSIGIQAATPIVNSQVTRAYRNIFNRRLYDFVDVTLQGDFTPDTIPQKLLVGLNGGREQLFNDRRAFNSASATLAVNYFNPDRSLPYPAGIPGAVRDSVSKFSGIYVQDQLSLGKHFKAILAGRYDKVETTYEQQRPTRTATTSSNATVPTFGLVWQPNAVWSYYASYTKSFRPSNLAATKEDAAGNVPDWPNELAEQQEVGFKADLLDGKLTLNGAAFRIDRSDVLQQTTFLNPLGNRYYVIAGKTRSQGGELTLQYKPKANIQIMAGYTYLHAKDIQNITADLNGARLGNIPHHSGNLWLRYNFPEGRLLGFGLGLGGSFQSRRNGLQTNTTANQVPLPGYTKIDTAFYYNWRNLSFALNVKNIADKRYITGLSSVIGTASNVVNTSAGDPRQLVFSVRASF